MSTVSELLEVVAVITAMCGCSWYICWLLCMRMAKDQQDGYMRQHHWMYLWLSLPSIVMLILWFATVPSAAWVPVGIIALPCIVAVIGIEMMNSTASQELAKHIGWPTTVRMHMNRTYMVLLWMAAIASMIAAMHSHAAETTVIITAYLFGTWYAAYILNVNTDRFIARGHATLIIPDQPSSHTID